MDEQPKQEKSTGASLSILEESEAGKARPVSLASEKALPPSSSAPSPDVLPTFVPKVSASNLLALLVMAGDFQNMKSELPLSWKAASSDGKIYWCARIEGHKLGFDPQGNLLVDGEKASDLLAHLLADPQKSTGGKS